MKPNKVAHLFIIKKSVPMKTNKITQLSMGALYFMINKCATLLGFMGALYFMINKFVTC
jgi:hypothetical protein